ncbi:hypothetical protein [Natronosalvus amylolyticus]|uniref:hypothetical protein n=1 Tax=Natronosalvus amylolyticus TaxID=2961994 RepID=UPI0020CA0AA8|nr:hypothetical protein [Natronosalvus amylolyticus]
MSADIDNLEPEVIERYPNGNIPAPRAFIDYDGQLVIRTRYGTIQRWTKPGWDGGRLGHAPFILHSDKCRKREDAEPMNPELEYNQFTVKYVETGERRLYEVRLTA